MSTAEADAAVTSLVVRRLAELRERVARAATLAGRTPSEVRILLASKTMPVPVVRAAVQAGGTLLGENRVQELVAKAPELADLDPTWHVIGPLQSNKVNAALTWASAVQSIDGTAIAERLSRRCEVLDRELDVMVQVNVSGEPTKSGVDPQEALSLATAVAALPRLHLTGLMTIGARSQDQDLVRSGFARLRALREEIRSSGAPGTATTHELSMGMSGDLELAIAEGSTMVRIGNAVFGPRPTA
ncbi:YggS family pyridoxal phosphate-dependent enzyme [Actinotalea sp.]|uniref:YggS family pyridoxal phosphate-dependent enzyme n=1 Tax=Actinotalea sp. TaxID=1872145 RepID=UPI00356210C4